MSLDIYLHSKPCPCCKRQDQLYHGNISHDLIEMAEEAGIYEIVWRPEENGIETAVSLVLPLQIAISDMRENPAKYKALNASNGWGLYENFLPFLQVYLDACKKHPDAVISVSR
jgi:hypothetical protein